MADVTLRDQIGILIKRDYSSYDYPQRSFEDVCDEYVALNDRIALVDILAELKHERGGVLECKEPLEEFYASSLGF